MEDSPELPEELVSDMFLQKQQLEDRLPLVEEGDIIAIDIDANTLNVKVSDEELAKRKENWKPRTPKVTTGYLARYASLVTSGNRGAVLEIKQ